MNRYLCAAIIVLVCFVSCSDDKSPGRAFDPRFLDVGNVFEDFSANGTFTVQGAVEFGSADSIKSIGIVYTDGILADNGTPDQEPNVETDNIQEVALTDLTKPDNQTASIFETHVSPKRDVDDPARANDMYFFLATFIKTKAGKVYQSEKAVVRGSNLKVISVYPAYAKAGQDISIQLNRQFDDDGKITANSRYLPSNRDTIVTVTINNKDVPIESTGDGDAFSYGRIVVKMPDDLVDEANVVVKAGDYSMTAPVKVKDADTSFKLLTDKDRNFWMSPALFASADAIYFGGGVKGDDNSTAAPDFWKYSIPTNTWTRLADMPSTIPHADGMSIYYNNKAWFGSPTNFSRYDVAADQWTVLPQPDEDVQYDHTFGNASYGMYDGKVYFTRYAKEIEIGIYYHNFWQFDPGTGNYFVMSAYPGTSYDEPSMDQAVLKDGLLHYFPGFEHWTYDPVGDHWAQLANVAEHDDDFRDEEFKGFSVNGQIYGILWTSVQGEYHNIHTIRIMKYDAASDSWTRDADVPFDSQFNDLWVFNYQDNAYLAVRSGTMTFYKIE